MAFSLLTPLMDLPIAVVDVETTGASASFGHRVIEIGIVRLERGQVVANYQQLFDPGRPVSWAITHLTGISTDMVAGQPRFGDRLNEIQSLLCNAAILGHNVPFDLSFLHREFRRAGVDLNVAAAGVPVLDTVRIARRRFGRGGNSLGALARRLGVEQSQAHRALADAQTTAAVFEAMLTPLGGYAMLLCDCCMHQGGAMDLARCAGADLLPLELEEALEASRPVLMEYVDANGEATQRLIIPLQVRRSAGELVLIAHCQLRKARRTFKLARIIHVTRVA